MKLDHVSYSTIKDYMTCPCMLKLKKEGKKSLPNDAMLAGSENHRIIAEALGNDTMPEFTGERFRKFCKYILGTPTGLEEKFVLGFLNHSLLGYIDAYTLIENQAVIVDWKSNPGMHDVLQLKIYALAIREKYPDLEAVHGYFFFLQPDYYEYHTFFPEDLDEAYVQVSVAIDEIILDDDFSPCPGPYCGRCPVTNKCPSANEFEIPEQQTLQDIVVMAQQLFAVVGKVKQAKKLIRDWMEEHSIYTLPVDGNNRYYLSYYSKFDSGKIKTKKDKEAAEKILSLISDNIVISPTEQVEVTKENVSSETKLIPEYLADDIPEKNTTPATKIILDKNPGTISKPGTFQIEDSPGKLSLTDLLPMIEKATPSKAYGILKISRGKSLRSWDQLNAEELNHAYNLFLKKEVQSA